jgi:hypothetical protein
MVLDLAARVAQSFLLLETLRPFLNEEPQSLKGKLCATRLEKAG